MSHLGLYLRNITQAYVQSTTFLNRQFYVRPPAEIEQSSIWGPVDKAYRACLLSEFKAPIDSSVGSF